jgi:hypothetical protein
VAVFAGGGTVTAAEAVTGASLDTLDSLVAKQLLALVTADQVPWLAKLDAELPNALAALSSALEQHDAELALQLVDALGDYWWHTHHSEDALRWIDAALELGRDAAPRLRAAALLNRGASRASGGQTSPLAMTCRPASSSSAAATTHAGSPPA